MGEVEMRGEINKGRRQELKMLKYKKRLKQLGLTEGKGKNYFAYRSHGSPCSCPVCSPAKYNRAKIKRGMTEKAIYGHGVMMI